MTTRTYNIDVEVREIRTLTVTVDKTPGRDDLKEAYASALASVQAGGRGELRSWTCGTLAGSHNLVDGHCDGIDLKGRAPTGTRYGWVITRDVLFDTDKDRDEDSPTNEAGAHGPRDAVLSIEQILKHGVEFQLLDDDGEIYYEGKIAWAGDYTDGGGFEPLDDFGRPNAGCTEIRYRGRDGRWEAL